MGIRKLKQKVAVALIAAMSVSNVLSAAAATPGTPSRVDDVKVTFDGKGGRWPTNIASKSFASKSNANGTVEEKEESTSITRDYLVGASEKDDSGNYYISLYLSRDFARGTDWMEVSRAGYERIAWFDGDEYLTDDSKKNLYNGAVLEAVWQAENTAPSVDAEVEDVLGKNPVIITDGLKEDEQLVLEAVPADKDRECKGELERILQENKIALVGNLEDAVGIELSVQKDGQNVNKVGETVEITLPVPKALSVEEDEKVEIKAIHFKENGKPEVYPVRLNDARTFMTLVAENGFSPFYFVKTKAAETTTIKIENVNNGYIAAWTFEENPKTGKRERVYLPLDEEVTLEPGTQIYLQPKGYGNYYSDGWVGRLESLKEVKGETKTDIPFREDIYSTSIYYGEINYTVKESCTIQADFTRWVPKVEENPGDKDQPRPEFDISVRPSSSNSNRYSGRISVEKWDAEAKTYKEIKGYKVRIATQEELEAALGEKEAERYTENLDKFTYENDVLYSKETLAIGSYEIPLVITYEDKEYLLEVDEEEEKLPYTIWVSRSEGNRAYFGFYSALVRYDEKNNSRIGMSVYSTNILAPAADMTWKDVHELLEGGLKEQNYGNGLPRMYNYPILSWQDENGNELKDSDIIKGNSNDFYTLFKKEDGTAYRVDAKYDDDPLTDTEYKVLVKNVDNGYLLAYTGNWNDKTYIPLDEEVTLPAGTKISLDPQGYSMTEDDKDWEGELTSLKLISGNEEKDIFDAEDGSYTINLDKDYTIEATFTKVLESEQERSKFSFHAEPKDTVGKYSSSVEVSLLSEDGNNNYQKLDPSSYTLRIANEDDFFKAGIDSDNYDGELFTYENGTLSSKEELGLDSYRIPFVITYQGQDWFYNEVYENAYSASVSVGVTTNFYHGSVKFGDQYQQRNGSRSIESVRFEKDGKENWSTAEALFDTANTPKMHGYKFVGWQNYKGEEYKADSPLVCEYENARYYTAFDKFVKADDETKPYEAPKATTDDKKPIEPDKPEDPNNPENPGNNGGNNGGNGGSSGGSGGGSRRHVVGGGSSTNSYSMTGNWVMGENGWTFVKSDGQKAANTWGWINGQYYYFDAQGNMATGWQFINGQWYYLNPAEGSLQGAMIVGVIYDPVYNAYFYANASGAMVTGWYQVGANWYYFSPVNDGVHVQGALLSGTYVDGYYLGADGAWIPSN